MKDSGKIENKIFVQIFDRNQTSVENERQPIGIEVFSQAPPKIDIGKLNWTDASFDKTLNGIDFGKITAEELNKILDQSLKQSNCPLGSFFEEGKGCVSIDTLSVVPSTPNTVDIEAIFNQPLKEFPDLKPRGRIINGDMKIEVESAGENAEQLLDLISKLKSNGTSSIGMGTVAQMKIGDLSNHIPKSIDGAGEKLEIDSFVDEGEIASAGSLLKSSLSEPARDAFGSGKIMLNIEKPNFEIMSNLPDELNPSLTQKLQLNVGDIQKYLQQELKISNGTDDAIVVEPQIIKETIPLKMSLRSSETGETSNFFQPLKISLPFQFIQKPQGQVVTEMQAPALNSNQDNVYISFGNWGKAAGEKLAQHIGAAYELNEDKLSEKLESELTTKAAEPKAEAKPRKKQQAFFVHELPLLNRKSLASDAVETTQAPATTLQIPAVSTTTQISSTQSKRIIPKLIDAGEEVLKTKNKILSNFFPKLFGGRRFANTVVTPDKENINEIRKNVPRPEMTFETVEGKTLSDNLKGDDETFTEGLNLKETTKAKTQQSAPTTSRTPSKENKKWKASPSIKRTSAKPDVNGKTTSFVESSTNPSLITENIE